jgi:hypothetical protein
MGVGDSSRGRHARELLHCGAHGARPGVAKQHYGAPAHGQPRAPGSGPARSEARWWCSAFERARPSWPLASGGSCSLSEPPARVPAAAGGGRGGGVHGRRRADDGQHALGDDLSAPDPAGVPLEGLVVRLVRLPALQPARARTRGPDRRAIGTSKTLAIAGCWFIVSSLLLAALPSVRAVRDE